MPRASVMSDTLTASYPFAWKRRCETATACSGSKRRGRPRGRGFFVVITKNSLTAASRAFYSQSYIKSEHPSMSSFQGKTVLVLGGSRGIGAAIVRRFVADGADVTFTYAGSPGAARQLA